MGTRLTEFHQGKFQWEWDCRFCMRTGDVMAKALARLGYRVRHVACRVARQTKNGSSTKTTLYAVRLKA